jgi:hypothetical protein
MVTWEEFRNGYKHNVNYGEIGSKILESKEPDALWIWVETQNFSEFEKGIVVGLMTAWVEIFVKNRANINFKTGKKDTETIEINGIYG